MQLTKNFNLSEFRCKDKAGTPVPDDLIPNVTALANSLQVLRDYLNVPIQIVSGYRTEEHNREQGGVKDSQHLLAKAADIVVKTLKPEDVAEVIEMLIDNKRILQGGIGVYPGFVHYDIRGNKARW